MKIHYILIIISLFFHVKDTEAQNIVGPWQGQISIPSGKLTIIFHIKHNDNSLKGTMDVIEQNGIGIPIHEIKYEKPFLTIDLPNLGIRYVGNVLDDDNIKGTFQQAGQSLPLHLVKNLKLETPYNKPQEPKPPFPYFSENVTFKNTNANITLSGTLTKPLGSQKSPTIILISGSGPQDRNQEILGHKPFLLLADQLTRSGFAVLRFDDRGTGKSTGIFEDATTFDFANDVAAAYQYLIQRNDINLNKIGLLGHSEGGIVAAITAQKVNNINFMVLLGSPAVRGKELMLYQKKTIEMKSNVPENIIHRNQRIFGEAYDIIIRNEQPLYNKLDDYFKHQFNHQISDKQVHDIAKTFSGKWFTEFVNLDPSEYYKQIKCPTLALYGEKDLQVVPSQNFTILETTLKHNEKATVKIVENVNHLFQTCTTGLPNEYGSIEETIAPQVLEEITNWLDIEIKN